MPFTMQTREVEDFRMFLECMRERIQREQREEAMRRLREIGGLVEATP